MDKYKWNRLHFYFQIHDVSVQYLAASGGLISVSKSIFRLVRTFVRRTLKKTCSWYSYRKIVQQLDSHATFAGRHLKKVCHKFKKSRTEATNKVSRSGELFMFTNGISDKFSAIRHDKRQPMNMPHLEWDGKQFQVCTPQLPPSIIVEITMMPKSHATFGWVPKKPVNVLPHSIIGQAGDSKIPWVSEWVLDTNHPPTR